MRVKNGDKYIIYCVYFRSDEHVRHFGWFGRAQINYQQFDGYPAGVGKDLAEFISKIKLVNGIPLPRNEVKLGEMANGAGCLFAQIVQHFKTEIGGVYIEPPTEEYLRVADRLYDYYVDVDEEHKSIEFVVKVSDDTLFKYVITKENGDEFMEDYNDFVGGFDEDDLYS